MIIKKRCKTCVFMAPVKKFKFAVEPPYYEDCDEDGVCHRYPKKEDGYLAVDLRKDWCGEYESDADKMQKEFL